MDKIREILELIKYYIVKYKLVIIIIIAILILFFIINIIDKKYKVESFIIELSTNQNIEIHYSVFDNDSGILLPNSEIELKLNTPNNKKTIVKCYYDENIISYSDHIITTKNSGKTEFYCKAGLISKTKSNVIEIEVK